MQPKARAGQVVATAILLLAPQVAAAHGEEALFLPVGQGAALLTVVVAALLVKVSWSSRVIALLVAAAVGVPPYFVTNRYVPYWIAFSEVAWFLVGFLPPVGVSAAFLAWRARARRSVQPSSAGARE